MQTFLNDEDIVQQYIKVWKKIWHSFIRNLVLVVV